MSKHIEKHLRSKFCLLCEEDFNDENPHFSKNLHRRCYYRNYDRIKWERYGSQNCRKKYNVKPKKVVDYDQKLHCKPRIIVFNQKDRRENKDKLLWFIDKVKKQHNFIDSVDCFRLSHFYEIYSMDMKDISSYPIEKQLIYMWYYLNKNLQSILEDEKEEELQKQ